MTERLKRIGWVVLAIAFVLAVINKHGDTLIYDIGNAVVGLMILVAGVAAYKFIQHGKITW